jgi:hypothetical protein
MEKQSLQIKNLVPVLMEFGKIKIGRKGKFVRDKFRMPEKIDHFIVTTMEKDDSDNYVVDSELMKKIGDGEIKEIPVVLLYNDIELNLQTRYVCYSGMTRYCSGDGESAMRLTKEGRYEPVQCPCERCDQTYAGDNGKGKCKTSGCLSVLIQGAEVVGGVWKFRTTGYNSVSALTASLLLIKYQTGGLLAGIPLSMIVRPKMTTNPIDGKPVKIYIVTLIYRGSPQKLREIAYQLSQEETVHRLKLSDMESEVRKMLLAAPDAEIIGDDEAEHVEEFHPEDAASTVKPSIQETFTEDEDTKGVLISPVDDEAESEKPKKTRKKLRAPDSVKKQVAEPVTEPEPEPEEFDFFGE